MIGEGGRQIAVIAGIARHPTPRKPKAGFPGAPVIAGIVKSVQLYANLGSLGTTRYKSFGFLVEGWGRVGGTVPATQHASRTGSLIMDV
jgi:hypothetical protein